MFFLKCLNDDDEIDDLIKREIDCRTRFILCDSDNARKSKWVQKEIKYITEQQKPIERIDLSKSDDEILSQLTEVRRKFRLFISYARADYELALQIKQRLSKYDFNIYVDYDSILSGTLFDDSVKDRIYGAIYHGCVIAILTEHGIKSQRVAKEIEYASDVDANSDGEMQSIIPIVIGNEIPEMCYGLNCIKFAPNTYDLANRITDSLLKKLLTPGQILTYYNLFNNGTHGTLDKEEAERLGSIYYEWATIMDAKNYPPAVMALGFCYEHGIGTKEDLRKAYEQYSDYVGNDGMGRSQAIRIRKILEPDYVIKEKNRKISFKRIFAILWRVIFIEFPKDFKEIVLNSFRHD